MYLTLIPIGSRGDVQPFVALGCALKAAGHAVRIATHVSFADFVQQAGLEFFPVGGDPQRTLNELTPSLSAANPLRSVPAILKLLSQLITPTLSGVAAACRDTDAVVASYPALYAAIEATDRARIPLLIGSPHPLAATEHVSHLLVPPLSPRMPRTWQRSYNRFSHFIGTELMFRLVRRAVDAARAEIGLGPCTQAPLNTVFSRRLPILHPYSSTLLPVPPDWPDYVHVTGFWFLDRDPQWIAPPVLVDFLAAGPPPIYVGFSSLGELGDAALLCVIDALIRRRQRAIVAPSARFAVQKLPDFILPIAPLPHSWLFPQLAGAIHHGGLGTTSEALRAGIAMGVVAFSVEQQFWGQAAQRIGVAPPPIGVKDLSPSAADSLISQVQDRQRRQIAEQTAPVIRAEHGAERAVALIERLLCAR